MTHSDAPGTEARGSAQTRLVVKLAEQPSTSTYTEQMRHRLHALLAGVCMLVGTGVGIGLLVARPAPQRRAASPLPPAVAAVQVLPAEHSFPVVGYGTVSPQHQVDVIPQVSGRIVQVHNSLAPGRVIPQGELLFEIDSTLYASQVRQADAERRRLQSVLARFDVDEGHLERRIANAERLVKLLEEEYETTRALSVKDENLYTTQQVAADEQRLLQQRDVLAELCSRRDMIPHLRAETQALLDVAEARLEQARVELSHTRIYCPFDARVEAAGAYLSQVVTAFFSIARLTSLAAFDLSVGIDPRELRWLAQDAHPDALAGAPDRSEAQVVVRSTLLGVDYEWRGYVSRFERVDEATRTARMVVEVRHADLAGNPVGSAEEPRASLTIGMFCRAELPGRTLAGALLVPRLAVHENQWVYVFEPDEGAGEAGAGRLGRRLVPVLRSLPGCVLVDYSGRPGDEVCELRAGEQVIVSPLTKPVVGMPLRLRPGDVTVRQGVLTAWAVPRQGPGACDLAWPGLPTGLGGDGVHPEVIGADPPLRAALLLGAQTGLGPTR
ncbi:MAG TPA: hypothetical protein PKH26_02430 [Phycisphaerae bacterium]|nr:hypothetical protein [Phycisphaerae bacterium]